MTSIRSIFKWGRGKRTPTQTPITPTDPDSTPLPQGWGEALDSSTGMTQQEWDRSFDIEPESVYPAPRPRQSNQPDVKLEDFSTMTGIPAHLVTDVQCVMWASQYDQVYFVALCGAQPQECLSLHEDMPIPAPPRGPLMWSGYVTVHTPRVDMAQPWSITIEGQNMSAFLQLVGVTRTNVLSHDRKVISTNPINALYEDVEETYTLSLTPQKKDQDK